MTDPSLASAATQAMTTEPDVLALTLRGIVALLLSLMIPATVYTFLKVRLDRKERQFNNMVKTLELDSLLGRTASSLVREEYSGKDYLLPAAFLSILCIVGFISFLFDHELLAQNPTARELFLIGLNQSGITDDQALILRQQSFVAMTMAFIGAFVWSTQNIIRRLVTGDLLPSTYFAASIRIIYSVLVALIMVFVIRAYDALQDSADLIPVLAFLTGLTPESTLRFIRDRVTLLNRDEKQADPLPLNMIEGINSFHRFRLGELAVDNAQNLAETHFIDLALKTPYNPSQIIDWIAQAKLYCYFKDDLNQLRKVGIRNAFDYDAATKKAEELNALAELTGLSPLHLTLVARQLADDPTLTHLGRFRKKLGNFAPNPGSS